MILEMIKLGPRPDFPDPRGDNYLIFFPAASIKVIDLYNHIILFPCEPLHSDTLVRKPIDGAQNVITEQKATESDKVFT